MSAALKRRDAFGPRQPTSLLTRATTFLGCAAMIGMVLLIETLVPNNPTLGGMLLLAVLFATWLLPTPLAVVITAAALVVTLITALTGAVDPLTAAKAAARSDLLEAEPDAIWPAAAPRLPAAAAASAVASATFSAANRSTRSL